MNPQPYILARFGAPDLEFASLAAMARAIDSERLLRSPDCRLRAVRAQLSRSDLPGGQVVAVRIADGAHAGKGTLIGYAFMPRHAAAEAPFDLMRAIDDAAERRQAA